MPENRATSAQEPRAVLLRPLKGKSLEPRRSETRARTAQNRAKPDHGPQPAGAQ